MTKRAALLYPDRKISETFLEFAGRLLRDLPSEAPHVRLSTRGRLHSDREIMGHHCESRGLSPLFVSPQRHNRYVRTSDQLDFIDTVLSTSAGKEQDIPTGSTLWRAQLGHGWENIQVGSGVAETEIHAPLCKERMKPQRNWVEEGRAIEGRVNAKGIVCLYAATHMATAIAEVRPWKGTYVTVAQLKTNRELQIINCTTDDEKVPTIIYFKEPEGEARELAVWREIDRGFSEPVTPSDDHASYVPTQIIAEFFRQRGFDGIAYRSSYGEGHNIALFNIDSADVVDLCLVEITDVALKYSTR